MSNNSIFNFCKKQAGNQRKNARQEIYSFNRNWENTTNLPIAFVTSMVGQNFYYNFEQALDAIEDQSICLIKQQFKQIILKKWQQTTDQIIKINIFRVLNRIKLTPKQWLPKAIQIFNKNQQITQKEIMIKQIAIYLVNNQNLIIQQQLKKQLYKIAIKIYEPITQNTLWFKIYIINYIKLSSTIIIYQQLIQLINKCLQTDNQAIQFQAVECLKQLDLHQKSIAQKVIQMTKFNKIIQLSINKSVSIEMMRTCISIIGVLLSGDQQIISYLIEKQNILKYLQQKKYHICNDIRFKIFWAYSNISASQINYHYLNQSISKFRQDYFNQTNGKVKRQIIFIIFNWLCNADTLTLQKFIQKETWVYNLIADGIKQSSNQFQLRAFYSMYNILLRIPSSSREFQSNNLVAILEDLYSKGNKDISQLIQKLLQMCKQQ